MHKKMNAVADFNPALAEQLPETSALLLNAGLCVHDAVDRITLHGSRGPQGGARPHSDLDLCLIVNSSTLAAAANQDAFLRAVLNTTLRNWQNEIELDLAAVFDKSQCGLHCFERHNFTPDLCFNTIDCMGLFKIQKGFEGLVSGPAVDCSQIYPLMVVWEKENAQQEQANDSGTRAERGSLSA